MHDIDKSAFASFLTQLRKERSMTQKDLAEKLFVSDKAVSKWERGLSLPDISLLIPLAEILGVTVTELLEGQRMPAGETIPQEQVEALVKKAITLSEPETDKKLRRKRVLIFAGVILAVAAEKALLQLTGNLEGFSGFQILEVLTAIFGLYFWCFMKDRLPDYYDGNRISSFSDGPFRMNIPGICFNNGNWPHMARFLRVWSAAALVLIPLVSLLLFKLGGSRLTGQMAVLLFYLASLFVPLYILGRKYDLHRQNREPLWKSLLALLPILALVGLLLFQGPATSRNATRILFVESGGWHQWEASYKRLDGTMNRTLQPEKPEYLLTVESESGTLDITITSGGELVFSEENLPTGTWPLTLEGVTQITVTAEDHKGSFSLTPSP